MNTIPTPVAEEKARQALCSAAHDRISKLWPTNTSFKSFKRAHPEASKKLDAAEKRLNSVWLACRGDLATMADFKEALGAWEAANYGAIGAMKAVR